MRVMCSDSSVKVLGGRRLVEKIMDEFRRKLYSYNSSIRSTGYYLKPMHVVVRSTSSGKRTYLYFGRYWWRLKYVGKRGRTSLVKWFYVGKMKPPNLPDPPVNPLEGISLVIEGEDVVLSKEHYKVFKERVTDILDDLELPEC